MQHNKLLFPRLLIAIVILLMAYVVLFTSQSFALAEGLICDHTIGIEVSNADGDGNYSAVQPGDTVCIAAGVRHHLILENFRGSDTDPVTFINYGGKVVVDANQNWTAILFKNSEHVRLTGTGDPEFAYGFELFNATNAGINVIEATRNFEFDHLEIHNVSGAGIRATITVDEVPVGWIQEGNIIHDNYLHHLSGDGMYIGKRLDQVGGGIELKDVKIFNNRLENIDRDGIQVRSAVSNVEVYNNYIHSTGDRRGGLNIVANTVGVWYNNVIVNAHFGVRLKDTGTLQLHNNTIVNSRSSGIKIDPESSTHNALIYDNIIAVAGKEYLDTRDATTFNNLVFATIEEAQFVDPQTNNYHLQATSPAVDVGSTSGFAPLDFDGVIRPIGSVPDIGAFEFTHDSLPESTLEPDDVPSDFAVVNLMLVNADTDEEIGLLTDGATIDFGSLSTQNLSVRADTQPSNVGSVIFSLDDHDNLQTENISPYTIAGDNNDGTDYNPWTPDIGQHTLTVTPYTEKNGEGLQGAALSVTFNVINNVPELEPTIMNLLGDEGVELNCDGRKLVLERLSKTQVTATCRPIQ